MTEKILIIDDDQDIIDSLDNILTSEGFQVRSTLSGKNGVEIFKSEPFGMVIMDIMIHGMDGPEIIKQIKHIDEDTQIIVLTGRAPLENTIHLLPGIGVFDYLKKPLENLYELFFTVNMALERRRSRIEMKNLIEYLDKHKSELAVQNEELLKTQSKLQNDIINFKSLQEELQQSNERYREFVDGTSDLVTRVDSEGRFTYVNDTSEKVFGVSNEECIGRVAFDFVHTEDRERTKNAFFGWISNSILNTTFENRQVNRITGEIHPMIWTINLHYDQKGCLTGVNGIARDLTEQKKAEENKQRLEDQIRQTQKMNAISSLAGGIAHKYNNTLSGITGNIELLKMSNPDNKNIDKYTDRMIASANLMANLSNRLLAYAEGGKYNPQTIFFSGFFQNIIPLVQQKLNSGIRVEIDMPDNISSIKADQTQIQMVLSELVENAAESMGNDGLIRIVVRDEIVDEKLANNHPGLKPGSYACLKIIDDGKGMDEKTRKRIFEPFFTTQIQGRGLGMAVVYGIIKNHNGWIGIDSEPGKGTVVSIYLPAVGVHKVKFADPKAEISSGTGTILLIEDDEMVMDISRSMVKKLGYRVLTANCGKEAIDIAQTFDGNIDMALLDMCLQDMMGEEIYPKLIQARPNLKVIICSGYAADGAVQEILDAGALSFIQKPFTLTELSATLDSVAERRKDKRFKAKKGATAMSVSDHSKQWQITDISRGGLSFSYNEAQDLSYEFEKLDITVAGEGFTLDKVPCVPSRTISDSIIDDDPSSGGESMNRYSVQFGELTPNQKDQLGYFIENYSNATV